MNTAVDTLERMLRARGRSTTALAISIFLRGLEDHGAVIEHLEAKRSTSDADVYVSVFLIQIYCWKGDVARAEEIVRDAMRRFAGVAMEDLVHKISGKVGEERIVRSYFVSYPRSTMQNVGFFEHLVEDPRSGARRSLITKLTTPEFSGTELIFYDRVYQPSSPLAHAVPHVVDVTEPPEGHLSFLTMEKVPGVELVVQEMTDAELDAFMKTYKAVAAVEHDQVAHLFEHCAFDIGHSHAYLVSAMQKVHVGSFFARINEWLLESVRTRGYQASMVDAVGRMVEVMERRAFHQRIRPELHYGLLHGDMHRFNVLHHEGDHRIIDWGKCTVGPKGIDLAVLFRRFPFSKLIELMERNGYWATYSLENKILFAYALVVVSVMIDLQNIKEEPVDQLFAPATDLIVRSLS